jgi:hypothetical protein
MTTLQRNRKGVNIGNKISQPTPPPLGGRSKETILTVILRIWKDKGKWEVKKK